MREAGRGRVHLSRFPSPPRLAAAALGARSFFIRQLGSKLGCLRERNCSPWFLVCNDRSRSRGAGSSRKIWFKARGLAVRLHVESFLIISNGGDKRNIKWETRTGPLRSGQVCSHSSGIKVPDKPGRRRKLAHYPQRTNILAMEGNYPERSNHPPVQIWHDAVLAGSR